MVRIGSNLVFRASRQLHCGVNSEIVDYALSKEALLRDDELSFGFDCVSLLPESPVFSKIPLSKVTMHVTAVSSLFLSPTFLLTEQLVIRTVLALEEILLLRYQNSRVIIFLFQ